MERGVVAEQDLPFAAVSRPIAVSHIANLRSHSPHDKLSVRLDSSGLLSSLDDPRLIQSLPLAADFHSCSLILEQSVERKDTVYLQVARPVKSGEALDLWFSSGIQALLGISFLSPLNIRGEKHYVCHYCKESFEYPNPLKIHIALDCGKLKFHELWMRLKDSFELSLSNQNPVIPYEAILNLSLEPVIKIKEESLIENTPPSPAHSSYSNPSPNRERLEEIRPSSEPPRNSAFRPYLSEPINRNHNKNSIQAQRLQISHGNLNLSSNQMYMHQQAAEIETLVSNLGQSKQGHLCLYCGKIYSRKYGLKIHIRTHTGFKPLKCKYCLRPFGDPSNLNKHVRLHAETETPYRCELCGKMLVRRRDLERHMKTRHNLGDI